VFWEVVLILTIAHLQKVFAALVEKAREYTVQVIRTTLNRALHTFVLAKLMTQLVQQILYAKAAFVYLENVKLKKEKLDKHVRKTLIV